MGQIHFTLGNQQPIVTKHEYIEQQQRCSSLTDTCSQMSRDWINAGQPHDKPYTPPYGGSFSWTPALESTCTSDARTTNKVQYTDYIIDNVNLIWTCFKWGPGIANIHVEPAAFIAYEKGVKHKAYIVFRGSQTGPDFGLDAQYEQRVNPIDVAGGTIMNGFDKYFQGLGIKANGERPAQAFDISVPGKTLYQTLKELSDAGVVKELICTGHSLGSTAATLTGALACKEGWFEKVIVSCSASPRVGTEGFKKWYDNLKSLKPHHMLNDYTWRLENEEDGVPKLPGHPYVEVGNVVKFKEKYGGGKEHNPCCTYSYAINNPENTRNPEQESCVFPT